PSAGATSRQPSSSSRDSTSSRATAYRATFAWAAAYPASENAAIAASCASAGGHSATLPASASTASTRSSGSTSQPRRQPVIAQNFENEFTTTAPRSR